MNERYEAIQIDGKWFVMDHRHPESAPAERHDEADARLSCSIWNSLVAGTFEAWAGI